MTDTLKIQNGAFQDEQVILASAVRRLLKKHNIKAIFIYHSCIKQHIQKKKVGKNG